MIRSDEFGPLLASVRATIEDILKPGLSGEHTRSIADAAIMTLDRIIASIRGDAIAQPRLETWEQIRADLAATGITEPARETHSACGFLGALDSLEHAVDEVQLTLEQPAALSTLVDGLRLRDPGTESWFSAAVAALSDLHDASDPVLPKRAAQQEADTADEASRLRAALNTYLNARFVQLSAAPIRALQLVPGGYSKQTAIFSLAPNEVLPERCVVRRDMAHGITPGSVVREYPYLLQAFEAGVKTPQPLLLETDASLLGGAFMLMHEVPDARPSGTYFPEDRMRESIRTRPDFGREVAAALARLHSKTRVSEPSSIPDYDQVARDSHASWCSFSPKAPLSLSMDFCYAWLLSHPPGRDRPFCTVHGDFGTHNILVTDGHLAAVVDWELAAVGDPADDLAQCRMLLLPGIIEWQAFVGEYVAAGGDPRACDPEAVAYFCVSLFVKHCLHNLMLRHAYLRGERTDIGAAALITHYSDRVLQYQARALRIAIDSQGG